MAVINLRNVVSLGVLDDGIYPSVYNGQTGEYIGTVDGEGDGVKTVPTLYMYYRKNGHLYLYRTKERIEIDLTNVTAYDNSALFKLTEKDDISNASITEFDSRNIDVGHYEYKVPWIKPTQQYLYILIPVVRSISGIFIQGVIANQLFNLVGIYVHQGKSWWIYRSNVKSNFDFNDSVNEILDVQVYVRELTADDLNPVEQLTKQLIEHINNKFNPHNVTKEQVGLGNVDNTSDMDKPVSNPQKEYIDAIKAHVNSHIHNYNNPHRVTADQLGLGNVSNDLNILKYNIQNLESKLLNKQDKTSEELITDAKRIVDAINEIYNIVIEHNNHIISNSIKRIEVTSEIPTDFDNGTLWIRIPRNEEDYINITINAIPSDAKITAINSEDKTISAIGSLEIECLIESRLHYIVEKENYVTKDVYVNVGVEDTSIDVVLSPKGLKTLIITSVPNTATINIKRESDDELLVSSTGTCTYQSYDPITVKIEVGGLEDYIDYSEVIVLDENISRNIELVKKPINPGYVILTAIDFNSKEKIAAYVYDKLNGNILGQITKDTPLQLIGDLNSSKILKLVSTGYHDIETTITYANPASNVTVEMIKTTVATGKIRCKAVTTESSLITTAIFEYHTGDENWKSLNNDGTGYSEYVTDIIGTTVYFRVIADKYIPNTASGIISSEIGTDVQCVLEVASPGVDVTIRIKAYDNYLDRHMYLTADIYDDKELVSPIGRTTPKVPFEITKPQGTILRIWVRPIVMEWYYVPSELLIFDKDKDIEVLCTRSLNGVIRIVTQDSETYKRISANVYDQFGIVGTTPATDEEEPLTVRTAIGHETYFRFESEGYETLEDVVLLGYDPVDDKIEYVYLNRIDSLISNNIKIVDKNDSPITDGSANFNYRKSGESEWITNLIDKEIVTSISDIIGTEYEYQIVDKTNTETIYKSGTFNIKEPNGSDIIIQWDRGSENDGIGYMQIEGTGIDHPIFRVK